MKKVKDDEDSILSTLPLWGLLFLVCVLFQVFVFKDRPLIQHDRQGSIVKTDQEQVSFLKFTCILTLEQSSFHKFKSILSFE